MSDVAFVYLFMNVIVLAYLLFRVGTRYSAVLLLLGVLFVLYGPATVFFHYSRNTDPVIADRILLCLALMWLGLLGGIELTTHMFTRTATRARRVTHQWEQLTVRDNYSPNGLLWPVTIVVFLFMTIVLLAENHFGKIYDYYTASVTVLEKADIRREMGASSFYLFNLLTLGIAPFLSFVLLLKAIEKKDIAYWLCALMIIGIVFVARLSTLQKSPAAIYAVQLILVFWLTGTNRISPGRIFTFLFLFFAFLFPFASAALPQMQWDDLLSYFYYRTIEVPQEVIVSFFTVYPDQIDHLYGAGIRLLSYFRGDDAFVPPALVVATRVGSDGASFNALFIADAWAEFGYVGVALTSLLLGVLVKCFDLYCTGNGKTFEAVALLTSIFFGVIYASSASFLASLITGGIVILPLLSWFVRLRISPPRGHALSDSSNSH